MSSFFVAMKGYRQRFQGHFSALCRFFPKKHLLLPLAQGVGLAMGTCPGVYWRMSGSCFLCQEGCANNPTSRQASWNTSNRLVPVVCHQLFCFTFCVVMCKHVLLQIIFCSCVIRTTFSREKWQNASLSCQELIEIWRQTWWLNDKTIIELGYRKMSWFVSVS